MAVMMKERDFQKQKVYDWEDRHFSRSNLIKRYRPAEMSHEDCTALVEDISRCYGLNAPVMYYPDEYQPVKVAGRYRSFPFPNITLYKEARQRYIILHEVSHYIQRALGTDDVGHGPQFFSIMAYLISEYMSIPLYEIFHKAEKAGIMFEKHNFPKFKDNMKPDAQFVKRYQ